MDKNGYPIRSSYEDVELIGDLDYKLFITNVKILEDREIWKECQAWLEEHIGKMWIDWAWPTAHLSFEPDDSERWIMMLFKNEEDALRFKIVWG